MDVVMSLKDRLAVEALLPALVTGCRRTEGDDKVGGNQGTRAASLSAKVCVSYLLI
jgi:hypothetical protein